MAKNEIIINQKVIDEGAQKLVKKCALLNYNRNERKYDDRKTNFGIWYKGF